MLLLLLLSHFSHVWLCATPSTAAHQTPLPLGFFRQEHWSGLPLPSPEEISSLSHSIVFLCILLTCEEGFLISPCYSLELCIQMGISFLFSFDFHFYSQLFVRPLQTTILHFYIFPWGCPWFLPPVQCQETLPMVLQVLCLIRSNPVHLFVTSTI